MLRSALYSFWFRFIKYELMAVGVGGGHSHLSEWGAGFVGNPGYWLQNHLSLAFKAFLLQQQSREVTLATSVP